MNILMQRSRDKALLLTKRDNDNRVVRRSSCSPSPRLAKMAEAQSNATVYGVMEYLHERKRLNLKYNIFYENCKDLSKWLFDRFNREGNEYKLFFTCNGSTCWGIKKSCALGRFLHRCIG